MVHLGAISATTETDGDRLVENNVRASLDLWEFCRDQAKPFIYASSAATYGDGTAGFDDDGSPEGLARLRPLNGYAWSKHLVDRTIARRVTRGAPLPPQWVGLKFFNVYGPNEYHKDSMRSVAKQLHEQAHATGRLRLFKSTRPDLPDGGQRRDFIYVARLRRGGALAARSPQGERPVQSRHRPGPQLPRSRRGGAQGASRASARRSSSSTCPRD